MSVRTATPKLVARATELTALRAAVEQAASGAAATVIVSGDAGVGKSRLVEELMRTARADGALVLLGRCVDVGDGELAYAPIAGALRSLVAQVGEADLDAALGPGRAQLARLVPELAAEAAAPATGPGPFGRAQLFELLLGALGRLGHARPVVLVVEDLHWADGSTRDLLRFLVRAAGGERLALIATYRTDDIHRAHPLRPYLVELRRDARVRSIDLEPFTRAEFNDHVAAILGTLPRRASLDRLCERSSGNAFFTEELLAASDSGQADPRTGMLQAYMFDTEALEFAAHGRRRVDVVRELFRTLVPGIDGQIIGVAHKAWQEDPWAGGGWGWTQPGQLHWMLPAMRRPEGRVHFAGEHTSLWIAWMNGALESGERVVQEILAAGQRPRAAA